MKKYTVLVATVVSVFMFMLGAYASFSGSQVSAEPSCTATTARVSVVGFAKQDVTPDRAVVVINVVGEDKDADTAMGIMRDNAKYVIDVAKNYTDEKHITTMNLNISQRGHWEKDHYVYDKFIASEVIKVDVAVDKVGKFLGEVTKERSQFVRLSGISFYYTKTDEVKKSLLEKAILDAKDNAVRLVKPLGAEHISLISVSYGSSAVPVDNRYVLSAKVEGGDIPISAGSQTISVSVNAVFQAGPVCSSIDK